MEGLYGTKPNWWSDTRRYRAGTNYHSCTYISDVGTGYQKMPYYTEGNISVEDRDVEFRIWNMINSFVDAFIWEENILGFCNEIHQDRARIICIMRNKSKRRNK